MYGVVERTPTEWPTSSGRGERVNNGGKKKIRDKNKEIGEFHLFQKSSRRNKITTSKLSLVMHVAGGARSGQQSTIEGLDC